MNKQAGWISLLGGRKFLAFEQGFYLLAVLRLISVFTNFSVLSENGFLVGFICIFGLYGTSNVGATIAHLKGLYKGKP
jgi:hypothetical protein